MEKLIITAAICGAEVTKKQNPAVPYTVSDIGEEAEKAYKAGASIIHLHVRQDDGTPTQNKDRFEACINEIKRRCPEIIIQVSTGGALGMSDEERLEPLLLKPEMATLDCGSCNFGGDDIFINSENSIKVFAQRMHMLDVKPEIEVFDKGMIDTAIRLYKKELIKGPMHFNFVMGVNGGISASPRDLLFMAESLPLGSTFTVTGIGKYQYPMAAISIVMGGHVRVGFEDNVYLTKGILAKDNGELVAKAARIAKELGRDLASPADARRILKI